MNIPPIDPRLITWMEEAFRPDPPTIDQLKDPHFPVEYAFLAGQYHVARVLANHLANQQANPEL